MISWELDKLKKTHISDFQFSKKTKFSKNPQNVFFTTETTNVVLVKYFLKMDSRHPGDVFWYLGHYLAIICGHSTSSYICFIFQIFHIFTKKLAKIAKNGNFLLNFKILYNHEYLANLAERKSGNIFNAAN